MRGGRGTVPRARLGQRREGVVLGQLEEGLAGVEQGRRLRQRRQRLIGVRGEDGGLELPHPVPEGHQGHPRIGEYRSSMVTLGATPRSDSTRSSRPAAQWMTSSKFALRAKASAASASCCTCSSGCPPPAPAGRCAPGRTRETSGRRSRWRWPAPGASAPAPRAAAWSRAGRGSRPPGWPARRSAGSRVLDQVVAELAERVRPPRGSRTAGAAGSARRSPGATPRSCRARC